MAAPRTVAVVLISHNYGRFLGEAIDSVLAQSRAADEIVVVDDSSDDDTPDVAQSYRDRGVRYVRVEVRNVHQARKAGLEATTAAALCFLDADDRLAEDYLELGLTEFTAPQVAVIYSDIDRFGTRHGRSKYPTTFDRSELAHENFIHAGSLVRREALEECRVFESCFDPLQTHGDWFLWRRVLTGPWTARKQTGLYLYRKHNVNWSARMKRARRPAHYFGYAGLEHEDLTLFVPLSGRAGLWPELSAFLERQSWPHDQTRLVLMDTSQGNTLFAEVRPWIARCDYGDVRHFRQAVGTAGGADDDRCAAEVRCQVIRAMHQIYNRMSSVVETDYVWILEDDIIPPDDVCGRLLEGFDPQTASVAAPYRSRYNAGYVAWNRNGRAYSEPGSRLETVGGNGFGCTILRRSVLTDHVFVPFGEIKDFDTAFYRRLLSSGNQAKLDWSCECEDRSESTSVRDQ